jgi:SAM-dependent methyltransferase
MPDWNPEYYRRWFNTPLGRMVDADEKAVLFELAAAKAGERVLDVGCGDGNYTVPSAELTGWAIGVDSSEVMLQAARRRSAISGSVDYVQAIGEELPFRDCTFDILLIVTVLCFVRNPQTLISEACRVLRPGGRLLIGELGKHSTWALLRRIRVIFGDRTWHHARFYSRRELESLLTLGGFEKPIIRGSVFYPPIRSAIILGLSRTIENAGQRLCPWAGALLIARAYKPTPSD